MAMVAALPTGYLAVRVYRHKHDLGEAVGIALVCPLVLGTVFELWIEDGRSLMESSWRRWRLDGASWRLAALLAGALIVAAASVALWLAVGFVIDG
jgi:hypothetical protein